MIELMRRAALAAMLMLPLAPAATAQGGGKGPVIGMPGGGCDSDFAVRRGGDTTSMVDPRTGGGCDGMMNKDGDPSSTRGARPRPRPPAPAEAKPPQERERSR